jgi:hypothetical protein
MNLVDLAGSDWVFTAGGHSAGWRREEGAKINRSLFTLGRIINQLAKSGRGADGAEGNSGGDGGGRDGSSGKDQRQRRSRGASTTPATAPADHSESTLTWLLKENLGGNSRTFVLAVVSPAVEDHAETLSTLRFAAAARRVRARATVNVDAVALEAVEAAQACTALTSRLERLQTQLAASGAAEVEVPTRPVRRRSGSSLSASADSSLSGGSTPSASPVKRRGRVSDTRVGTSTKSAQERGGGRGRGAGAGSGSVSTARTKDGGSGSGGGGGSVEGNGGFSLDRDRHPSATQPISSGSMSARAEDAVLESALRQVQVKLEASEKRRAAAEAGWNAKLANYERSRVESAALGQPWSAMASSSSPPPDLLSAGEGGEGGVHTGVHYGKTVSPCATSPGPSPGSWTPRLVGLLEDPAITERVQYVLKVWP